LYALAKTQFRTDLRTLLASLELQKAFPLNCPGTVYRSLAASTALLQSLPQSIVALAAHLKSLESAIFT
jgi:hypothetical protein